MWPRRDDNKWQRGSEGWGVEKVRQMVQRDDNGAISQQILHLWRDGGCCWMRAEINAMDERLILTTD